VIVDAAAVVRELYEQLLRPLRGYTSKQTAALMQTLDALLEHADAFNRSQAPHAVKASRRTSQPVRKRRQAS
jgi:hypothetical protein